MRMPARGPMVTRRGVVAGIAAASAAPAWGRGSLPPQDAASRAIVQLPEYAASARVSGTIGIWGHGSFKRDFVGKLVNRWIAEFRQTQPGVGFDYRMYGTASAIGALYTGAGNLALLGEEISPAAARAFERERGYPPTGYSVATGSLDVNFFDYAHMVFVHRDNPVRHLSLRQLEGIFGTESLRGGAPIRRWGDLGLGGEWAGRAIQPYGWETDEDFGLFFRERVLGDSHRWNPAIREYPHLIRADGSQYDHGQRILDALAADPAGIAISNIRYAVPAVRALALGWDDAGPFVGATPETLIAQAYPLTRIIPAFVDRAPGKPIDPALREFLAYLLSRQGQQALVDESGYLPVGPAIAGRERGRLA